MATGTELADGLWTGLVVCGRCRPGRPGSAPRHGWPREPAVTRWWRAGRGRGRCGAGTPRSRARPPALDAGAAAGWRRPGPSHRVPRGAAGWVSSPAKSWTTRTPGHGPAPDGVAR